jgi:predicted MFS family arabinose efflux permease
MTVQLERTAANRAGARPAIAARANLVLATLFAGAFAVGCAEMLVVGVLDLLSDGLHVSVPAAGALVTANALGLAVGGPALTALTLRLDRRRVLVGSLAAFVLVTATPVVSPTTTCSSSPGRPQARCRGCSSRPRS